MIATSNANYPSVGALDAHCNDICILLPVLNEIDNIDGLIIGIRAALQGRDYVICIVDDGSRDGTAEFIKRAMGKLVIGFILFNEKRPCAGPNAAARFTLP